MVKARHPVVAARIVGELGWFTSVTCLQDVKVCARALGTDGRTSNVVFIGRRSTHVACAMACGGPVPSWVATRSLNESRQHFRDTRLMPTMTEPDQALLRSQGGPLAATSCSTALSPSVSVCWCFAVSATRRWWPCSLRNGRGVGSAGFCRGERGGSHLP